MKKTDQPPLVIAVLQRGFVFVGRRTILPTGRIALSPSRCIRRWGTRNVGLAGLKNGPLEETVLDAACDTEYHPLAEVFLVTGVTGEWGI